MGSIVRLVAILTSVIVLLGFAFFATDELEPRLAEPAEPAGQGDQGRPRRPGADRAHRRTRRPRASSVNGTFRELVDDANDVLLGPFTGLVDSDDRWVTHGVPALLALLLYGFGLGMLANMLPKERETGGDWRRPPEPSHSLGCAARNFSCPELLPEIASQAPSLDVHPGGQNGGTNWVAAVPPRGESRTRVPHSASSSASPSANPVGPKGRGHG